MLFLRDSVHFRLERAKDNDLQELSGFGINPKQTVQGQGMNLGYSDYQNVANAFGLINIYGTNPINGNQPSWSESFTYDANGNRTSKVTPYAEVDYTYNSQDELVKAGNKNLTYDNNGNLVGETLGKQTSTYQYNGDNRLTNAWSQIPGVGDLPQWNGQKGVINTYDALDRRASRVEYDQSGVQEDTNQAYLYDGNSLDILAEFFDANPQNNPWTQSVGYKKNSLVPVMENTLANGQAISRLQYQDIRWSGNRPQLQQAQYQAFDPLGSLNVVTSAWQGSLMNYSYDAWGTAYEGTFYNNQTMGYNGKRIDIKTGLYDYGYRNYSPEFGRFTTQDPIRDGSNWYVYANNDPVNFTDPTGLDSAYAMKTSVLGGLGHAGMWVQTSTGYSFFQVTDLNKNWQAGTTQNTYINEDLKGAAKDSPSNLMPGQILSNTEDSTPKGSGGANTAGAMRIDFTSKDALTSYLAQAGFDSQVHFDTTTDQDKSILDSAVTTGQAFSSYSLFGNSCGTYGASSLEANGKGITSPGTTGNWLVDAWNSWVPTAIGSQLNVANPGSQLQPIVAPTPDPTTTPETTPAATPSDDS